MQTKYAYTKTSLVLSSFSPLASCQTVFIDLSSMFPSAYCVSTLKILIQHLTETIQYLKVEK